MGNLDGGRSQKATTAWGNSSQQIEKLTTGITDALDNDLAKGLTDLATGATTVKQAFSEMAQSILKDIESMIIKMLIQLAVQGVDQRRERWRQRFIQHDERRRGRRYGQSSICGRGGEIRWGTGTRDDVPAMLTGGEFVINRHAADSLGTNYLHSLNAGAKPEHHAAGGYVGYQPPTSDPGMMNGGGDTHIHLNVDAGGNKKSGESDQDHARRMQKFGEGLESAIKVVITKEKRAGGLLAK